MKKILFILVAAVALLSFSFIGSGTSKGTASKQAKATSGHVDNNKGLAMEDQHQWD